MSADSVFATRKAAAFTRRIDVQVVARVGVTLRTMGLSCVTRRDRVASEKVLSIGHRLEVIGVAAGSIPTEVVDVKAAGNGTDE